MADVLPKLEQNLKAVIDQREQTKTLINKYQDDLQKMFAKTPKKPRGSMMEIDKNLVDLENRRTRTSLSLTEEKQLLKKISAAEKDKRQLQESLDFDKKVQVKRAQIQEMRNAIKPLTDQIATLEKAVSKARLAKKLGCQVEELQKTEMECPADKIGKVIGKNGAMVKKIEEVAGVSLDIDAEKNIIVINGSVASFAAAKEEITKIIMATEENVDVPAELILYLTTNKSITVLEDLKQAHPDVHFDVARNNKKTIPMRGLPEDIAKVKESLRNLNVVKQERELTSAEAMLVIGKKGANIEKITAEHKAAIEVEKKDDNTSLAIVAGPEAEVEAAMKEIEDLLDANKEVTKSIPCGKAIREALLSAGGVRIKDLQKKINESTKAQNAGTVLLSFDKIAGDSSMLVVKGKNAAMGTAVAMVGEAIREIDTSTIRIMADKHAIPQIIGKGGENIKKIKEGKQVNIEVDKKTGEIAINGLNQEEVAEVEAKVLAIIAENNVQKIPVDPSMVELQYRELIRSKTRNEITELARLDLDKGESSILLRGTHENVQKAAEMVKSFLESNYIESIEITDADRDALLSGGQKSKIVSLANELEVNLPVDRATSSIQVRGTVEKVKAAVQHINSYLYGGEGNICTKIAAAEEALGIVIGKGGKARKALETKYPGVAIYIHRSGDAITIRGPEETANNCRFEILKMMAKTRLTQSVSVTEKQMAELNKSNLVRRMTQHIPVQCTLEETTIKVRGVSTDVKDAVALLNEHLTGVYESTIELGASQFAKIKGASRDASHFARMKDATGAEVSLDATKNSVVIRGKKNNVKKAKFQVLDFLAFLVPGEFGKVKLPKAMHSTVGQATALINVAATTGASVVLDRDLSMILIQSSEKASVAEATKLVESKVGEAEKLVYVFEFDTSEAWLIPGLIGKSGNHINTIRKESGCNIDISREERTVVVSGTTEESVSKAKAAIQESIDKAKRETVFVAVPTDAMPKFVGKGGAHIDDLRKKFDVEIETMKKGSSKVKITGDESKVSACKEAVEKWVAELAKPEDKKSFQIQRHHISAILGKNGANVQALQDEFGCKIDLDREKLTVSIRGDPAKQELALRKIEEIMAENPATERASKPKLENEEKENSCPSPEEPKKKEQNRQRANSGDSEERVDRTSEFPQLPVGVAPSNSKSKKRRTRKPKAAGAGSAAPTPTKSVGSPSWEESSVSDEDDKIVARDPAADSPKIANVGA